MKNYISYARILLGFVAIILIGSGSISLYLQVQSDLRLHGVNYLIENPFWLILFVINTSILLAIICKLLITKLIKKLPITIPKSFLYSYIRKASGIFQIFSSSLMILAIMINAETWIYCDKFSGTDAYLITFPPTVIGIMLGIGSLKNIKKLDIFVVTWYVISLIWFTSHRLANMDCFMI